MFNIEIDIFVDGTWSIEHCGLDLGKVCQRVASSSASTFSLASRDRSPYGIFES